MADKKTNIFGNLLDDLSDAAGGAGEFLFGKKQPEDFENYSYKGDGVYESLDGKTTVNTNNVISRLGSGAGDVIGSVGGGIKDVATSIRDGQGVNTFLQDFEAGFSQPQPQQTGAQTFAATEPTQQIAIPLGPDGSPIANSNADPALFGIDTTSPLSGLTDDFENLEFAGQDADGNDILNVLPGSTEINPSPAPEPVEPYWEDWRVRLSLGPEARILYNTEDPNEAGILFPLRRTRGIVFPYTPNIAIQYSANYEAYDLVHSNYRGYFYRNSAVQNVLITATFTAQDTEEANYMLAAMHFLRSATKMFYGKDIQRGMPPPLVFLHGFGEYHFKDHPCVITNLTYNLPNDVDYIPAGVPTTHVPTNQYQQGTSAHAGHMSWSAKMSRLHTSGLREGGQKGATAAAANAPTQQPDDLAQLTQIYEGKTYVPTKIDLNFTMFPVQTRDQVSNEFSLKDYASGKLLKKGFW